MKKFCILFAIITIVLGKRGYGPTDQEWGFVTVRDQAHMFWWLHYTTADVADVTDRPLVIWLQGGPGASSTGYGNFVELGPIDIDGNERNTSWVKDVNLLFVDNPVGTGFSYVDDKNALTTNNKQIGNDFLILFKSFTEELPKFKNVPTYIFSESYGGKMTVDIALALHNAIQEGKLEAQLKGIGLGDSWISPIDSVLTWAPYLKNLDLIDDLGYDAVLQVAKEAQDAMQNNEFVEASELWETAEYTVQIHSNVDFYNVLTKIFSFSKSSKIDRRNPTKYVTRVSDEDGDISRLMNGPVREALNISQQWGLQGDDVFDALFEDFMKPVTNVVEVILNSTDIIVAVYNGQLDLIVDSQGTLIWLNNLKWSGSSKWPKLTYKSFGVDGWVEGYIKELENLKYFSIMRSGHMVPKDNPAAMRYVLQYVTNNFSVN